MVRLQSHNYHMINVEEPPTVSNTNERNLGGIIVSTVSTRHFTNFVTTLDDDPWCKSGVRVVSLVIVTFHRVQPRKYSPWK